MVLGWTGLEEAGYCCRFIAHVQRRRWRQLVQIIQAGDAGLHEMGRWRQRQGLVLREAGETPLEGGAERILLTHRVTAADSAAAGCLSRKNDSFLLRSHSIGC